MTVDNLLYGLSRIRGIRSLLFKRSIMRRVRYGLWSRPHYAFGVHKAAELAGRLGLSEISVVELGVAGGNGLVALEDIATQMGRHFGIRIAVFGFDMGSGLPRPVDYRDVPHVWGEGFYHMDEPKLRSRLTHATLIIGDVGRTIPEFVASGGYPPLGFVAFDLDYYSSTKAAFGLFGGPPESRLPRVYCYFDDVMSPDIACHNEFIGELCAIREFNSENEHQKLCAIHGLRYCLRHFPEWPGWTERIYVFHDFLHSLYARNVARPNDSMVPF